MDIEIEINPSRLDQRLLARLFGKSAWGREEDYLNEGCQEWLTASDNIIIAVALDKERTRLLGFIRAFTDHATVTWISELLVDPDHRNQGIGSRLMNEVIERTCPTALYTQIFTGTEKFFEKFKLTPKPKLVAVSRKPLPSDVV